MASPAAISGILGSLTGASFAANVHRWEMVTESETHEYTVFGTWDNQAVAGVRRHTGTVEFVVVDATDELSDIDGSSGATAVSFDVILLGNGTTGKRFEFSGLFDNITLTTSTDDVARGTATFVADGAVTFDSDSTS